MSGEVASKLADLAEGWRVTVSASLTGWSLVVERRRAPFTTHRYHGTDLARIVDSAHAGEPAGRVA